MPAPERQRYPWSPPLRRTRRRSLLGPPQSRKERGCPPAVPGPRFAERSPHVPLLPPRKPCVDCDQDWKHHQCHEGRPLQEEAEHDDDERDVLGVPHVAVRAFRREPPILLRLEEDSPS